MIETIKSKLREYRGSLLLLRDKGLSIEVERQGNISLIEDIAHQILDALFKGDEDELLTFNEFLIIVSRASWELWQRILPALKAQKALTKSLEKIHYSEKFAEIIQHEQEDKEEAVRKTAEEIEKGLLSILRDSPDLRSLEREITTFVSELKSRYLPTQKEVRLCHKCGKYKLG